MAEYVNRRRGGQLLIGRLTDHGVANYQFRAREDPSYYVKLVTSRGERTLWGKDLQRAVTEGETQRETQPKVGDLVGVRRVGREAVTITTRERNADGRVVVQQAHHAHRTRWVLEKVTFFAQRARLARKLRDEQIDVHKAVRASPELKSTFLTLRAAEELAERRIADPKDRVRFLDLVRAAMAESTRKGEPLPSVRLREKPQRGTEAPKALDRKRDEPTR